MTRYSSNCSGVIELFTKTTEIQILQTVVGIISILGSLIIIVTYFIFLDMKSTARKILVFISFSDIFTVFPYVINAWYHSHSRNISNCKWQSFFTTTAVMWSFFWTSSLAIYVFVVITRKNYDLGEKLMLYFHFFNWLVPIGIVTVSFAIRKLGCSEALVSGGWCWISMDIGRENAIKWMFITGKGFEIPSYFIILTFCFLAARKLKTELRRKRFTFSQESTRVILQGRKKLIAGPVMFVFLRGWGTVRFFIYVIYPYSDCNLFAKVLAVLHIIGDSSQGFVFFILYCLCTTKFLENCRLLLSVCCKGNSNRNIREILLKKGMRRAAENEYRKYLLPNDDTKDYNTQGLNEKYTTIK
ncbi:G-protein coupled receptor 157-like isoform X1 [Xenia sp. Carnegie-2017]|uniref:G-protein coupled receptor 157-like isoform X1 n=1 Tax=Xenia sp. Carnegie-2017 TaxID=2897299 RepID=UPI001F03FFD9|nr:G-protein coupled receptor 157-like isoform X1 [Xenia sp. Carnegie-2017]